MTAFLLTALGAALLGSVHCAAMCGPLVGLYTERDKGVCAGDHATFALARLGAYLALGVLAGLVGHAIDAGAATVLSWQRAASVLAGVALVAMGAIALVARLGVRLPWQRAASSGPRLLRLSRGKPRRRAAWVGALTAALPCGWLYAFVLAGAGTGSPLWGAATMAMLWLGSSPILAAVGFGLGQFARRLGGRAAFVTPVMLIVAGVCVLALRASVPTVHAAPAGAQVGVPTLGAGPSCHGD